MSDCIQSRQWAVPSSRSNRHRPSSGSSRLLVAGDENRLLNLPERGIQPGKRHETPNKPDYDKNHRLYQKAEKSGQDRQKGYAEPAKGQPVTVSVGVWDWVVLHIHPTSGSESREVDFGQTRNPPSVGWTYNAPPFSRIRRRSPGGGKISPSEPAQPWPTPRPSTTTSS